MSLNNIIDQQLEALCEGRCPDGLREYLLFKYGDEPFPHQYTEQDLSENIRHDIQDYKAGKLDLTLQTPRTDRQELEELQHSYIRNLDEARELRNYIAELEAILSENGLVESRKMAKQRLKQQTDPYPF